MTAAALTLIAASVLPAHSQVANTDPNAGRVAQANAPGAPGGRSNYQAADNYSLLPYTRHGYVGISGSRSEFKNGCGNGLYGCESRSSGFSVYTGGLFSEWGGMELGYLNTGKLDRVGGQTRAEGIRLSLLLRAPIGPFNVFAKGGAIYGQTQVSTGLLSDVSSGKRRGWGASYGLGVGFDFTPTSGLVLEWTRNQFRFPGNGGREDVDSASLGYIHRF